ncbi:HNH endonuclease [Leifsonia aquatica]|uniref:HNH endonuclease n=1 Tax=Leifsonia aquatica TaxID=144185 RepID=UPI003803D21B
MTPTPALGIPEWGGRRAQDMVVLTLETYGTICRLCGLPGADSADHIVPRSKAPELTWELSNLRPAHKRCNEARGNRELVAPIESGIAFFQPA